TADHRPLRQSGRAERGRLRELRRRRAAPLCRARRPRAGRAGHELSGSQSRSRHGGHPRTQSGGDVIEWLTLSKAAAPSAPMLLCVPFAGAGPSAYRDWPDELPGVEVRAAYLPGRERRFREQAPRDIAALTADPQPLAELVEGHRYALFGHSFGALVAFELCRTARRHGLAAPEALLVSGCRAPDLPARQRTYELPDDAFVRSLDDLGGTPPAVRANRELMELLLPTLRADFAAAQTYRFSTEPPLTTPITAFCGQDDP